MQRGKAILGLALLGLQGALAAQTPLPAIQHDDVVPGIGSVESVDFINVNDAKMWTALAITNADALTDACYLRGGFLSMREGMELAFPAGTTLNAFEAFALNKRGDIATVIVARIPGVANLKDSMAWNLRILGSKDDPFIDPLVPPGTVWNGFDVVRVNDRNEFLVSGDVKANIAPSNRDILIKYQLDDLGNVVSRNILTIRGKILTDFGGVIVANMPINENAFALNNKGDVLNVLTITTNVSYVFRNMVEALAVDGTSSPVNRNWTGLINSKVALNDRGDYVLTGTVTGDPNTDFLIVKNGVKFAQEGDILPELSDQPIATGSNAPINIGNNGDVFWHTGVLGGSTEAYMRNYTPILRRGQDVGGKTVTKLEILDTSFHASPNGRYFACGVDLDGRDAVLLIDFGVVLEMPGCFGNPGKLTHSGGSARVGQFIEFAMDNGQVPGALARINFSSRQRIPNSECGVLTPSGELMISRPHRLASLFPGPWNGADPTRVGANIPPDLSLVDAVLFAQGIFRSPSAPLVDVRMTNALRIEIGAP